MLWVSQTTKEKKIPWLLFSALTCAWTTWCSFLNSCHGSYNGFGESLWQSYLALQTNNVPQVYVQQFCRVVTSLIQWPAGTSYTFHVEIHQGPALLQFFLCMNTAQKTNTCRVTKLKYLGSIISIDGVPLPEAPAPMNRTWMKWCHLYSFLCNWRMYTFRSWRYTRPLWNSMSAGQQQWSTNRLHTQCKPIADEMQTLWFQ